MTNDDLAQHLQDLAREVAEIHRKVDELHRTWTLAGHEDADEPPTAAPVQPGSRVSWTDPLDASNNAWTGTVEFVGVDRAGKPVAHVDFKGYGRRNLPVDDLIVGIIT
jgi:hypothetical protein